MPSWYIPRTSAQPPQSTCQAQAGPGRTHLLHCGAPDRQLTEPAVQLQPRAQLGRCAAGEGRLVSGTRVAWCHGAQGTRLPAWPPPRTAARTAWPAEPRQQAGWPPCVCPALPWCGACLGTVTPRGREPRPAPCGEHTMRRRRSEGKRGTGPAKGTPLSHGCGNREVRSQGCTEIDIPEHTASRLTLAGQAACAEPHLEPQKTLAAAAWAHHGKRPRARLRLT